MRVGHVLLGRITNISVAEAGMPVTISHLRRSLQELAHTAFQSEKTSLSTFQVGVAKTQGWVVDTNGDSQGHTYMQSE